jgi:hypothetical protein
MITDMLRSPTPAFIGFLLAVGVLLYIIVFGILLTWISNIGELWVIPDPFSLILVFCFSAQACIGITLGYPVWLMTKQRTKEAIAVFTTTLITLGIFAVGCILIVQQIGGSFGLID